MGQQQWVDVPLPRRLNLDGAYPTKPDESRSILNIITNEASWLRQRKGFTRQVGVTTLTAAGDLPFSVITSPIITAGVSALTSVPTRALVGYFVNNQSGVFLPYRSAYPGGPVPSGYNYIVTGDATILFVNADNPAAITVAALTDLSTIFVTTSMFMPFGNTVSFDYSTFGASVGTYSGGSKTGPYTGTHLVRWAGSNRAPASLTANALTFGSPNVTLSATATPSLAGTFMNAGTADPLGSRYNYYVLSHTAGTAAVTLSKPYGLGDSAVVTHGATAVNFSPIQNAQSAPPDIACVGSYLSRLFVGRPSVLTTVGSIQVGPYPNAVAWSNVNEPERWTDTNIAILDNNTTDMVMGFATLRNMLVIFRRWSTWVMTGTDESSFTFQQISTYGCLDCRSITNYEDGVFFMSDAGLIYFDGSGFTNVTSPGASYNTYTSSWQTKPGIRTKYVSTSERFVNPESYPLSIQATTILPRTDYLLMIGQNLETASDARHDQYLYHIPSQSWTRFNSANTDQVVLFTKPGQHLNNVSTGFVGSEGLVNLDVTVEPEFMALGANQRRYDESYNAATDATTTAAVKSTVAFPDVRPTGGMFKLHRVILEHNIWKNVSGAILGPDIFVGVDPFYGNEQTVPGQTTTVGNVTPRYEPSETAALYDFKYSTELAGTVWPVEGTTIRVSVSTEFETLDVTNASHGPKYYGLRLLVESTDDHMTDNPITS